MGNKFEEAIATYLDLNKSGMFQSFLEQMSQIFDSKTNPIMDEAEKNLKPEEKNQSIFNIPFSNPEEMNKISTSCLLTKAKAIIDELKKPVPETMGKEEKQAIYDRSKLPATLVEIKKTFDKRYAAVMKKYDNKEDKNFDEKFPDDATFNEFRLYNSGKLMIDKLGDVSLEMYNGINLSNELEKSKNELSEQTAGYEKYQDRIRYEFDAFKKKHTIPLNLGRVYSEEQDKFVDLVISNDLRNEDYDFFFAEDQGLHKWEKYFADEEKNQEKLFSQKMNLEADNYKKAVRDTEEEFAKKAEDICAEYAKEDDEQLQIYKDITDQHGKRRKLSTDYAEYTAFTDSKIMFARYFNADTSTVSDEYKKFKTENDIDEYFKSNSESYYAEEFDKVSKQISALEKQKSDNEARAEEFADTLGSAIDTNITNHRVGEMLDEADILVAEQLAALSKAMHTNENLVDIQDFDDNMFATSSLLRAKEEATQKYKELSESKNDLQKALSSPIKRSKEIGIDNFINSVKELIDANDQMVNSKAYKGNDTLLRIPLSLGITKTDFANLNSAYKAGDMTKAYENISRIITFVDKYREDINSLKSSDLLANNKNTVAKIFKNVENSVDAFNKKENIRYIRNLADDITNTQKTYQSKIEAIKKNIKDTFDEKVKQRADIDNFKANELRESNKRADSVIPYSEIIHYRQEKEKYENQAKADGVNLQYLNELKNVLEKGKIWYKIQETLPSDEKHRRYEELTNILSKREERLNVNEAAKKEKLDELAKEHKENVKDIKSENDRKNDDFHQRKLLVRNEIAETKHIRTALTNAKNNAANIKKISNRIDRTIKQETRSIEKRFEKKLEKNISNENKLLSQVLKSAKKIGPDSDVFKKLKTAIINYQNNNDPQNYRKSNAYTNATAELNKAIDAYIDARGKGSRWTKQGQLRLEYVKSLQNCLKNNLNDIKSYKKDLADLASKKPQATLKPKSKMEYDLMSQSIRTSMYGEQYAKLNNEDLSMLVKGVAPLTEEQNKAFAEQGLEEDRIDASLDNLKTAQLLEKATEEAYEKMENPEEEVAENKEKAAAVIPEIEYIKPVNPNWENEKEYQPEEIVPIVEAFNKLMENVPNDYGFAAYNKGRLRRKSLEDYKKENLAAEQFMKDNNLNNPKLSKEQCKTIADFDKKYSNRPNLDFGYREYVLNELKNNDFPMGKMEFVQKKFNITEGRPMDAYLKVVKDTRRKFYEENKIDDPRKNIKNYGEIVPETQFIMDTIESKVKAAQKAAQKREKIIGEVKKFFASANKVKSDYGFKDVVNNPNFFTKENYINSGEGRRRYLAANPNIRDPRDPEGKNNVAPNITVNGKKVLNFDLSNFDPDKLVVKNRTDVDVKADRRFIEVQKDVSEYPAEVQEQIRKFEELMNSPKVREFGYEAAKKEYAEACKQEYIKDGKARTKFMADNITRDPRKVYEADILKDPILTEMYRPDLVKEMDVILLNMGQLKESDSDVKYEKDALTVINNALTEIRDEETDAYNPLSLPLPFDDPNGGKYFDGFEDYPKDLQEQIKVYDRIIASVPDNYGFNDFKKNVDYFDKISKEEYVAQGIGKQYFAQKHQMVNPRDAIKEAEKLAKTDAEISNRPFDAKKFREDLFNKIAVYDKKMAKFNYDAGYNDAKKNNPDLTFEAHLKNIKKDPFQFEVDRNAAKAAFEKNNGVGYDPRIDVPNYGRVVIHKSEYKPKHLFNDNERIRHNAKIVNEVKQYIEAIKDVQLDYGFQKFKPGDDVENYVSKKEYCLSDAAKDLYIKEKNIANPIVKYAKFIDKDKELRSQIREVTKDYIANEKARKDEISTWDDPDGEKEILRQREIERAKTKNLFEKQSKDLKESENIMYKSAVNFLDVKKTLDSIKENIISWGEDGQDIQKREDNYMSTLTNYRKIVELEENTYAPVRATKRYCDKLTIDNIETEQKALEKLAVLMNQPAEHMIPKDKRVEGFCFNMRYRRLQELKREREIIKENPGVSKENIKELLDIEKQKTNIQLNISNDPDDKLYKAFNDMVFGK